MCDECKQLRSEVRETRMLLRRVGLLLVTENERALDMESSVLTKDERERRKLAKRQAFGETLWKAGDRG